MNFTKIEPREYQEKPISNLQFQDIKCTKYSMIVVALAAIATFVVQLLTHCLPLGALVGLGIIFTLKIIPKSKMDTMMNGYARRPKSAVCSIFPPPRTVCLTFFTKRTLISLPLTRYSPKPSLHREQRSCSRATQRSSRSSSAP